MSTTDLTPDQALERIRVSLARTEQNLSGWKDVSRAVYYYLDRYPKHVRWLIELVEHYKAECLVLRGRVLELEQKVGVGGPTIPPIPDPSVDLSAHLNSKSNPRMAAVTPPMNMSADVGRDLIREISQIIEERLLGEGRTEAFDNET